MEGIKIAESDPKDRSVGYGGRPDRSGRVTLDACIMNAEGKAGSVTYVQRVKHPTALARMVMEKRPMSSYLAMVQKNLPAKWASGRRFALQKKAEVNTKSGKKTSKYQPIINIEARHHRVAFCHGFKRCAGGAVLPVVWLTRWKAG